MKLSDRANSKVESIEFNLNDSKSLLGKGSYAQVFLALDSKTKAKYALKIVRLSDQFGKCSEIRTRKTKLLRRNRSSYAIEASSYHKAA